MDTRVAVISIIVEDNNSIETLNQLLYDARDHIIGRFTGYHQCSFRQDWPTERCIHEDRLFQCHHTHGGKT